MKHRLVSLLFAFSLIPFFLKGQSMASIFKLLPSECIPELNSRQRDSLLRYREFILPGGDSTETAKYDLSMDEINHYFRYEFSFTTGQSGFKTYEVRKFKRKDRTALILFCSYGGTPRAFDQHEVYTFAYQTGRLIRLKKHYLPNNISVNAFLKQSAPDSIKEKADRNSSRRYELFPEAENEISYLLYLQADDEEVNNYLLGDKISFIWTGEFFLRRKVSFTNNE